MNEALYHFFADLLDKEILDREGRPVGELADIAFALPAADGQRGYPRATHLILRRGLVSYRYAEVPWNLLESLTLNFNLDVSRDDVVFSPERPRHEFTLARDILDKQVVDTNGQKVIRVNDARLLQVGSELRLHHVDVGPRGIVRRLGWQWWVDAFVETFLARTEYLKDHLIQWSYIQPLTISAGKGTLKLTVDQKQLALIPRADFGDMMLSMDMYKRLALFKSITADLRPKVFSDFDLALQKELLENLDLKEAADLLARIPADQTTDLLEDLPKSVADSLLAQMETTTARRLSTLLGYTSDSAGGLMTTEYLSVVRDAPVADVLAKLRQSPDALENFYFVYLFEGESRLTGQVPLRRLLLASPQDPVAQYSYPKPIYVRAKDSLREVAYVMEKYKLPVIPVVDSGRDRRLQGVISMDDILSKMIPLAWRRRPRRAPAPPDGAP